MKKSSYQHEKIFPNSEFLALKERFKAQDLHITVEIASCNSWAFNWNVSRDSISGVIDLEIRPNVKLVDGEGNVMHQQRSPRRFRIKEPLISRELLIEMFFGFILEEIKGLKGFVD